MLRIAGAAATGGLPYMGMDIVEEQAAKMRYAREIEEKERDRKSSSSIDKEEREKPEIIESVAMQET